ncbi:MULTISPECIES: putative signal transducing protein [unclassified Cupriavidus]|uniref:putative signal transducing protein n=1 Tax=Cupriavidus sp. H19C3 TaxID=3241603 RepID=UPI003BF7FAE3
MKLLLKTSSLVHAAHCRNVLRAAGFRAELRNTWLAGAAGDIPFQESAPQVWIADDANEAEAWAVLNAAANPPPGPRWQCSHCDEWHEAQFAACWRCGRFQEAL